MITDVNQSKVDRLGRPAALYPSYKSFDDMIDVDRLKSLDSYVTSRIELHAARGQDDYFINEHRLNATTPSRPGVREIWLSRTKPGVPYNYLDLDNPELWERTPEAEEFSLLTGFIDSLPFKAIGRMLIIYDVSGNAVPAHRDHFETELCHNFIWFRTNLNKPFYMLNEQTGEKLYVESYSAWFDTVNQFHGTEASNGLSFSIRVDGIFADTVAKQIPRPEASLASSPALWAAARR